MSRHITVHSDGTAQGTVILNADGEKVPNIRHASVEIDAREGVEVTLEIGPSNVVASGFLRTSTFYCKFCDWEAEHECDVSLGGQPAQPWQGLPAVPTVPPGHSIFDFEICGKTFTMPDGKIMVCYVNKAVDHGGVGQGAHYDAKTGESWMVR